MYDDPRHVRLLRPVTVILIGAGHPGTIYTNYALEKPDEMKVVAVADMNRSRREKFRSKHAIKEENLFSDWTEVFKREKFADAVIIAAPDNLHTQPCLAALEKGYDVLLEKPIAPTEEECRLILEKANETNKIVGVCHVLRYSPYFRELKEVLDAGLIRNVISIQHLEPIEQIYYESFICQGQMEKQ